MRASLKFLTLVFVWSTLVAFVTAGSIHELSKSYLQDQVDARLKGSVLSATPYTQPSQHRTQNVLATSKLPTKLLSSTELVSSIGTQSLVSPYFLFIKGPLSPTEVAYANTLIAPFSLGEQYTPNLYYVMGPANPFPVSANNVDNVDVDLLTLPQLRTYMDKFNINNTSSSYLMNMFADYSASGGSYTAPLGEILDSQSWFLHFLALMSRLDGVIAVSHISPQHKLSNGVKDSIDRFLNNDSNDDIAYVPTHIVNDEVRRTCNRQDLMLTHQFPCDSTSSSTYNQDSSDESTVGDGQIRLWVSFWPVNTLLTETASEIYNTTLNGEVHSNLKNALVDTNISSIISHWSQLQQDTTSPCNLARFTHSGRNHQLTVTLPRHTVAKCVEWMKSRSEVSFIEYRPQLNILNNHAKGVLQDQELTHTKIWSRGLNGRGQIVIVGDTGVDHDHCMFYDLEEQSVSHIGKTKDTAPNLKQRKIVWYLTDFGDDRDDRSGHGTHVAGTLAGDVDYHKAEVKDNLIPYNGHATGAKLVVLDFKRNGRNELQVPDDLYAGIFKPYFQALDIGISSHSWGGDVEYSSFSADVDRFVYNNPYHLPVFAAGNSGDEGGLHTVLSPGNAKNVLTVGASDNLGLFNSLEVKSDSTVFRTMHLAYREASFGGKATYTTQHPTLIIANPIDACSPLIFSTESTSNPYDGLVVIVRRGTCPFVAKANEIYKVGGVGMIVVSDTDDVVEMGPDTTPILFPNSFPSVMVARKAGDALIAYLAGAPNGQGGNIAFPEDTTEIWRPATLYGPITVADGSMFSHTMADFSSRGPTLDGRIKPDIVAPGNNIRSAKSDGTVNGVDKLPNCATAANGGIVSSSGTSMATPAVAGLTAIVKQYFEAGEYAKYYSKLTGYDVKSHMVDTNNNLEPTEEQKDVKINNGSVRPTAAALKALLVGSGQSAGGSVETHNSPDSLVLPAPMSPYQGWGLVNLDRLLMFADQTEGTEYGSLPPTRLYLFDSLTEDIVTIQTIARFIPTDEFKEKLAAQKVDSVARDITVVENLYTVVDNLLPSTPPNTPLQPRSFVTSTDTAVDTTRCSHDGSNTSCGLPPFSMHTHCGSLSVTDAASMFESMLFKGALPTSTVTNTLSKTIVDTEINITQITGDNFSHKYAPYTNNPSLARASLSWTDPPATENAHKVLLHDLDLVMHASSDVMMFVDIDKNQVSTATVVEGGSIDIQAHVAIDWSVYKKKFPLLFASTDKLMIQNKMTGSFVGKIMSASHTSFGNELFINGYDESSSPRADRENNVEQATIPLSKLTYNAYVLAAAIHMNVAVGVSTSVRTNSLTKKTQHYALVTTGVIPSDISPAKMTVNSTSEPMCGVSDMSLFCPNNCSGNGQCVNGFCECDVIQGKFEGFEMTVPITFAGDGCGVQIEPLRNTYSDCISDPTQCVNDPLGPVILGPIEGVAKPWSWDYYTVSSDIIRIAEQLADVQVASAQSLSAYLPKSLTTLVWSEYFVGIRLNVVNVDGVASGDPDLFVRADAAPTLTSHDHSNKHCDTCTRGTSASSLGSVASEIQEQKRKGAVVKSLSISSNTVTPMAEIPDSELNNPTILWVKGEYLQGAPQGGIFVGVYGYCCNEAKYNMQVFIVTSSIGLETIDFVIIIALIILIIIVVYLVGRLIIKCYNVMGETHSNTESAFTLDPRTNAVIPHPPREAPLEMVDLSSIDHVTSTEAIDIIHNRHSVPQPPSTPEEQLKSGKTKTFWRWNKRTKGKRYEDISEVEGGVYDDEDDIEKRYGLDGNADDQVTHVIEEDDHQESIEGAEDLQNNEPKE